MAVGSGELGTCSPIASSKWIKITLKLETLVLLGASVVLGKSDLAVFLAPSSNEPTLSLHTTANSESGNREDSTRQRGLRFGPERIRPREEDLFVASFPKPAQVLWSLRCVVSAEAA